MAGRNHWGLWGGIALIVLGLIALLGQFLQVDLWAYIWPLFIIAAGLACFVVMRAGGQSTGALAIPGSIITTIGLLLFFQNLFDIWATWAYAWALIIAAVGVGLIIFGIHNRQSILRQIGRVVLIVGLALFFIFGLAFELGAALFGQSSLGGVLWPLALILLGLYFLIGRPLIKQWGGPVGRSMINFDSMAVISPGAPAVEGQQVEAAGGRPAVSAAGVRRVYFNGVGDLTIYQGEREGLEIEANQAILERIRVEQRGDSLDIRLGNTWWDWFNPRYWNLESVRYSLYLRDLTFLDSSGLGNLLVPELQANRLELIQSGTGNVTCRRLVVDELVVRQSGVGNIEVAGRTDRQDVHLSGTGNYVGGRFESRLAQVSLSGLGNATVWVFEKLDAQLSGAGNVEYYGNPQVSQRISGVGNIRNLGVR